jgi:hypothetical protein
MLFVYVSPVFSDPERYDVHIYDHEKDLYPLAKELLNCDSIPKLVSFLKDYHARIPDNNNVKVQIKIQIHDYYDLVTPAPENPDKFITIFDMLDFYNSVTYESPSEAKNFHPANEAGILTVKNSSGDEKDVWSASLEAGKQFKEQQPLALLTLLELRSNTAEDYFLNPNLDNCIQVCKTRIYESSSPSRTKYRKQVE